MYSVTYSRTATKALAKLRDPMRSRIMNKIEELKTDPFSASGVKSLTGAPGYRARVGDWRIVYTVTQQSPHPPQIHIAEIATRGQVYKS